MCLGGILDVARNTSVISTKFGTINVTVQICVCNSKKIFDLNACSIWINFKLDKSSKSMTFLFYAFKAQRNVDVVKPLRQI